MFDADRPITRSDQDRLNRSPFAKYLAHCLLEHKDPESLVIGLYGGWGAGKTSVINLMIEEIQLTANNQFEHEQAIVLNFSPWSYSGQNELVYHFFRRLSACLRNAPHLDNRDQIIYLLELYVSFFTNKPVPSALRLKRSLLDKMRGKHQDTHGWESGRDLTSIKAELNELLRNQKHKIIIVIDNISRLYEEEIKQIFQMVKSMGDYANTAYVLAFDKEQVINAINRVDGSGGADYVEKVVQLPFEIPPIAAQDLENILADRLSEVVATAPDGTWNSHYWADIYYSSLKFFFDTCRDITRYVNTLSFGYTRSRDVVNPVDFFALTALEVFCPAVYYGIRDNKDLFSDLLDHVYKLDEDQIKKDKLRCDEILARNDRIDSAYLLELLIRLFPRLRHLYQPTLKFYHSDILAHKAKRLCSPDYFDAYFRLSLQNSQILQSEFDALLSLANNNASFDQAITRLNQDNRVIKFLDMLDAPLLTHLPSTHIASIITALLDNGDLFPSGMAGPLSLDTSTRIHRIIHRALEPLPSEDRFIIMQNAIAATSKSIYITVHELREQGRTHIEEEDTFVPKEFRDFTGEQLQLLRKLTASRIEIWASDGRLETHPHLFSLLIAWSEWGDASACTQYVEQLTAQDRGLLTFLVAVFADPIAQAMAAYQRNPAWQSYLDDMTRLIDHNKLTPRAKLLFEDTYFDKLREKEQLALMIFLDLAKTDAIKSVS